MRCSTNNPRRAMDRLSSGHQMPQAPCHCSTLSTIWVTVWSAENGCPWELRHMDHTRVFTVILDGYQHL